MIDQVKVIKEKYSRLLVYHHLKKSDGEIIDSLQVIVDVQQLVKLIRSYEGELLSMCGTVIGTTKNDMKKYLFDEYKKEIFGEQK